MFASKQHSLSMVYFRCFISRVHTIHVSSVCRFAQTTSLLIIFVLINCQRVHREYGPRAYGVSTIEIVVRFVGAYGRYGASLLFLLHYDLSSQIQANFFFTQPLPSLAPRPYSTRSEGTTCCQATAACAVYATDKQTFHGSLQTVATLSWAGTVRTRQTAAILVRSLVPRSMFCSDRQAASDSTQLTKLTLIFANISYLRLDE